MSRHWYSYIGFGIKDDNLSCCTLNGIRNLIKLCSNETQDMAKDFETLEDFLEYEFDLEYGVLGASALFIEAVSLQEDINLYYAKSDDEDAILLDPVLPWHYNSLTDAEKQLTEEKFNNILAKYQRILEIPEDKMYAAEWLTLVGYC